MVAKTPPSTYVQAKRPLPSLGAHVLPPPPDAHMHSLIHVASCPHLAAAATQPVPSPATAKTSKGCGIVKYSKPEQASAALLALNGVHTFDGYSGSEGPMVVEWMDSSRLTSAGAAAGEDLGLKPL